MVKKAANTKKPNPPEYPSLVTIPGKTEHSRPKGYRIYKSKQDKTPMMFTSKKAAMSALRLLLRGKADSPKADSPKTDYSAPVLSEAKFWDRITGKAASGNLMDEMAFTLAIGDNSFLYNPKTGWHHAFASVGNLRHKSTRRKLVLIAFKAVPHDPHAKDVRVHLAIYASHATSIDDASTRDVKDKLLQMSGVILLEDVVCAPEEVRAEISRMTGHEWPKDWTEEQATTPGTEANTAFSGAMKRRLMMSVIYSCECPDCKEAIRRARETGESEVDEKIKLEADRRKKIVGDLNAPNVKAALERSTVIDLSAVKLDSVN